MLDVTHLIHRRSLQPGEDILQAGDQVAHFYMIARGAVEVIVSSRRYPSKLRLCCVRGSSLVRSSWLRAAVRWRLSAPPKMARLSCWSYLMMVY